MSVRPDFIVIGAQKAGTTTLFRWLTSHPDVHSTRYKEVNYFSPDSSYGRGDDWYAEHFAEAGADQTTGECSPLYMDPAVADDVASRICRDRPDARLVAILREPVARLRSHYRHEVQRARESGEIQAVTIPGSSYVRRSLYSEGLEPFIRRFPSDQMHVCVMEQLMGDADQQGWDRLLAFLQLSSVERPTESLNVSAQKPPYRSLMGRIYSTGITHGRSLPKPLRPVARRLLLRPMGDTRDIIVRSRAPLPEVEARMAEERSRLCEMLGWARDPWAEPSP